MATARTRSYVNAALADAKCFACLDPATLMEVETYLLAYIYSAAGMDPSTLAKLAKCFQCLSYSTLLRIKTYLLAKINEGVSGGSLDLNVLLEEYKCFTCVPKGMLLPLEVSALSTDPQGPGTSDPSALAKASACFHCLNPETLLEVQVYLLCLITGIPPDPNQVAQVSKSFQPIEDWPHNPIDPGIIVTVEEDGISIMCTDVAADLIPVLTGNYDGTGALTTIDLILPKVCCDPFGWRLYGSNSYDMSGAVYINGGLIAPAYGGTSNYAYNGITLGAGGYAFYAAVQVCGDFSLSGYSNRIQSSNDAEDWAQRVVDNGGTAPDDPTIQLINIFVNTLRENTLWDKFKFLNIYAPNNLTAARTPLIVGGGSDPWTNIGPFVEADLDARGLAGDGSSKILGIGLTSLQTWADQSDTMLAAWAQSVEDSSRPIVGVTPTGVLGDQNAFYLVPASITNAYAAMPYAAAGAGAISGSRQGFQYLMMTRWANNDARMFQADVTNAHAQIGSNASAMAADYRTADALAANGSGATAMYTADRVGMAAAGTQFSLAESAIFYNAIATLRTGFLSNALDAMADSWATRVVTNGGAAPSAATTAALATFWAALKTAGISSKMLSICALVPDSLIAAITPLVNLVGNDPWTNNNFVAGDLTVNGLLGANTKYLDTGVNTTDLTKHSAGMTAYIHTGNNNASEYNMGAWVATTGWGNLLSSGNGIGDSSYFTGGTGRISAAAAGFTGYLSTARTASNVFKLWRADSGTPHAQLGATNATSVSDQRATVGQDFYALANNNTGVATQFTTKRISFLALHEGLSQAESSDFYDAIQALRVALGGGYV